VLFRSGARGIGFAIAERLLQSGAHVCLWDVDAAALDAAKAELSALGRVHTATVDITSMASVDAAAASTIGAFGKIDILVNNAGIAGTNAKTWETDPADWQRVMAINLNGPFHCCHAVVPHMLKNGYGRIVNIASIAGKEGNPNAAHYSASKAGVVALTKSLGKELATKGILVNAVQPGPIATDMVHPDMEPMLVQPLAIKRLGTAEEIASIVLWLASDDSVFATGQNFIVDGGITI
jgi:3-oxoacyl-[acyl-carrier protein] reductase